MTTPRVLVVEDDHSIRDLILLHLSREGYAIDSAATGEEAMRKIGAHGYQLFLLDWMLPGVTGLELARQIRAQALQTGAGILMVTARAQTGDIVAGLEAGADDYVTKPFDVGVLTARVRALLRRQERLFRPNPSMSTVLKVGGLEIDEGAHEVRCNGEPVILTPSEFKLLLTMAENRGRVLTRDTLIENVQGEGVNVIGRSIDTHIFGLRKKLGDCADFVETIRGVGYRIKGGE